MNFKDYQEKYFKTKPNYLAVFIVNNLEFNSVLDLGCGSGNETVYMLKKGKKVIALDKELNEDYILSRIKNDDNLTLKECGFEDYDFPNVDAILATFSLSFCSPDKFDDLLKKIYNALPKGGIFAGNIFGKNDLFASDKDVNVFSKEDVEKLLSGYDIIKFKEQEYDLDDQTIHRHYYDFVAIKL